MCAVCLPPPSLAQSLQVCFLALGTSTPTFGQSTLTPGVGASGSSLSFGTSSTPTQGFVGVGPFGKQLTSVGAKLA
jgi:hypothetical protein